EIETTKAGREIIVVTEIPYLVNKADMIKRTAELVNEKKLEGISEIRDESAKDVRIIYEVKRDANANVVLNNLFTHTSLQTSLSVKNIALGKGRSTMMRLEDMIAVFVEPRHYVIVRRTKYKLSEAETRAHILEGYLIALDHFDAV